MAMPQTDAGASNRLDGARLLSSRWLWCVAALLFVAAGQMAHSFADLALSLGDTDDATRLYQVRQLIASGAWFDMTLPRLGGAAPLVSHWSRLIDAPLVMLLGGLGLVMSSADAELATRVLWPLMVLFVFLCLLVRAADQQSGAVAAAVLLALAVTSIAGLGQFRIGRIDHHNVMIAGSIGGLLLMAHARVSPGEGYLAGALIGIALAVGYEPLPFLAPILLAAALLAIGDLAWLRSVRNMTLALAGTLTLVFAATVAPTLWLHARCDALSLNMVALATAGAGGLAVIDCCGRNWSGQQRLAALVAAGALGIISYAAMDVRCVAGPFGQVDPALHAVWLDHVLEVRSVFAFYRTSPDEALTIAATIALGLCAAGERWRRLPSPQTMALLGMMVIIAPAGLWMLKLVPYANWVATFCIALSVADLGQSLRATALTRQLLAIALVSQYTVATVAGALVRPSDAKAALAQPALGDIDPTCLSTPAIRALATLPTGRFVGSIDFGAYIVALTQHDALAAPYHRIDQAILANHAVLHAAPDTARRLLNEMKADYVILCVPPVETTVELPSDGTSTAASLTSELKAGRPVAGLEAVQFGSPVARLRVWRVLR